MMYQGKNITSTASDEWRRMVSDHDEQRDRAERCRHYEALPLVNPIPVTPPEELARIRADFQARYDLAVKKGLIKL